MRHQQRKTPLSVRSGAYRIELFVAVTIIALLAALILPGVQNVRGPSRASPCFRNLRNIGLAVQNYQAEYGVFPPAYTVDGDGRRLHSWRTLILPYLDQTALYESIDLSKPWDDPANAVARNTVMEVYQCPTLDPRLNLTTYSAMVGPDACFLPNVSRHPDTISDGTANTLMVIELPPVAAVPWMAPHDGGVDFLSSWPRDAELAHGEGTNVIFADGHGRFLKADTLPEQRAALITVDGGETVEEF